ARPRERAGRAAHRADAGAAPRPRLLTPPQAFGNRETVVTDHAHLGSAEAFGRVTCELGLGLVTRRPATAGIAAYRAAHGTEGLVQRNAERLRLYIPYRDVDAGNRLHDDAAATAFVGLCHTAGQRGLAA